MGACQAVQVVETCEEIYAFGLIPWKLLSLRQIHQSCIALVQRDGSNINVDVVPRLIGHLGIFIEEYIFCKPRYRNIRHEMCCSNLLSSEHKDFIPSRVAGLAL